MTWLEVSVMHHYIAKGIWDKPFDDEATLLRHSKEMLSMLKALVVREAYSTRRGTADLIVCYWGRFIAAELKDNKGTPTKQQLKFLKSVERAGGSAGVVTTLRELMNLLCTAPGA